MFRITKASILLECVDCAATKSFSGSSVIEVYCLASKAGWLLSGGMTNVLVTGNGEAFCNRCARLREAKEKT